LPNIQSNELKNYKFVEHHIFAEFDQFLWDSRIFICDYIRRKCNYTLGPLDSVINNPVEKPPKKREYRDNKTVILGRIGRPDNFCSISLDAIKILIDRGIKNFKYWIVNPCDGWRKKVEELKLKDYCTFIDPIYSDEELQEFFNQIDILAHARSDGEINSLSISQAQINGVPVVTHYSPCYNGQAEQVKNGLGFITKWNNPEIYASLLYMLLTDPAKRNLMGKQAQEWALKNIEASIIVKRIEDVYERIMKGVD
jgi:glycosyltransferase involved in cell wall biosynthesis